jgi:hypothetical protein
VSIFHDIVIHFEVTRQTGIPEKRLILLEDDGSRNATHVGCNILFHVLWKRLSSDDLRALQIREIWVYIKSRPTSSMATLPPGFRILFTSSKRKRFPSGGSKLMTQLEMMQSTESDSIGRGSVRSALVKATCGGLSPFAAAFERASAIISYKIVRKLIKER